jgi:hypothetical protein
MVAFFGIDLATSQLVDNLFYLICRTHGVGWSEAPGRREWIRLMRMPGSICTRNASNLAASPP